MGSLQEPYYVGLLTAAAIHGFAHQQPMAFQVMVRHALRPIAVGRSRIDFHGNAVVADMPTQRVRTETGTMTVATPATMAFDLVRFPGPAGGLGNIATVLLESVSALKKADLAAIAPLVKVADVQRLGYLLDLVGAGSLAVPLWRTVRRRSPNPVLLAPSGDGARPAPDARWRIIANEAVEVDA